MFAIEKKTNIIIDNLVVEKFPAVANFHDVIESCRERKSSCLPLSLSVPDDKRVLPLARYHDRLYN